MTNTTAKRIAAQLDNDGSCWETKDERTLDDLCEAEEGTVDRDGEFWRYVFPDGSALTGTAGGWDLEGSEPFLMAGAE